jgi:hypothetical protein
MAESVATDEGERFRKGDGCEGGAVVESIAANGSNGSGDSDGCEGGAAGESSVANGSNGSGDSDGSEGCIAGESATTNDSDGVGLVVLGYGFRDGDSAGGVIGTFAIRAGDGGTVALYGKEYVVWREVAYPIGMILVSAEGFVRANKGGGRGDVVKGIRIVILFKIWRSEGLEGNRCDG